MANPKGLISTIDEVSQTIDFNQLAGVDLSQDETLVREMGQAVIDYIKERSASGRGIGGVKLASPYSKDYADSEDFKAAGKNKNKVNMRLSGDMLESIDIVSEDGAKIKIAVAGDQTGKAFGHMSGFEGHPTISGPKRPFFGLTQSEIKEEIISKFKSEIESVKENKQGSRAQAGLISTIRKASDFFTLEEQ